MNLSGDVTVGGTKVPRRVLVTGGALAGSYVAWRWWSASRAGSVAPTDAAPADEWTTSGPGGPVDHSAASAGSGQSDDGSSDELITTADGWTRAAVDYLAGVGYDPSAVATALGRYLGGEILSPAQADVVRAALASLGRPPGYPALPIRTSSTVTPAPSKPPAHSHTVPKPHGPHVYYTAKGGETLASIAAQYHPHANPAARFAQIAALNPSLATWKHITAGQRVRVA